MKRMNSDKSQMRVQPRSPEFNVDWQNIFHGYAPPSCSEFNIELNGARGLKFQLQDGQRNPLHNSLAEFFPSTESTCPRCCQLVLSVSHLGDYIASFTLLGHYIARMGPCIEENTSIFLWEITLRVSHTWDITLRGWGTEDNCHCKSQKI